MNPPPDGREKRLVAARFSTFLTLLTFTVLLSMKFVFPFYASTISTLVLGAMTVVTFYSAMGLYRG